MNKKLFDIKLSEALAKAYTKDTSQDAGPYDYSVDDPDAANEVKRLVKFYAKMTGKALDLNVSPDQILILRNYYNQERNAFVVPTFENEAYCELPPRGCDGAPMFTLFQEVILWNHYMDEGDDWLKNYVIPYDAVYKPEVRDEPDMSQRPLDIFNEIFGDKQ